MNAKAQFCLMRSPQSMLKYMVLYLISVCSEDMQLTTRDQLDVENTISSYISKFLVILTQKCLALPVAPEIAQRLLKADRTKIDGVQKKLFEEAKVVIPRDKVFKANKVAVL